MIKKTAFLATLLTIFQQVSLAQDQHLIDSLQIQLKQLEGERTELRNGSISIKDSSIAKILKELSWEYMDSNPDLAMDYSKQMLALSERIGWKKGIASSYNNFGMIYGDNGNYPDAVKNHVASLKIQQEIGNKKGMAGSYNNIGTIYEAQGNYPEALKEYFHALKINEETGNKSWISYNYNNIGNVYKAQSNYPEALKNYMASLKICEEIEDEDGAASAYNNIGGVYGSQGNNPEALKNFFAGLKKYEEIGNKYGAAFVRANIGVIYQNLGNYSEALKSHFAALKIREEIGDKRGLAVSYINIGINYNKQNLHKEAKAWLQKSLALSKAIGAVDLIKENYKYLVQTEITARNYKDAYENYKLYILYKDSLFNEENTKKLTQIEMQYEFDKKEAYTKAEQEKKDAIALEEIDNQKLVRNGFIGGFATVLLFAGTFFRQRNKIRKGKRRSDELLLNILPEEVAEELKETGTSKAKAFNMVSVMFTDFKDFTKISEKVSAEMLVDELHACFSAFDTILHKHNVEKIKTIGDAYMCVSGLPLVNQSHATDMVNAALEILEYMTVRKKEKDNKGDFSFEVRIGINSGPVVAGIVGLKKFSYDIWGDTVNTAARMENNGESGKINISGTTYELVRDKFNCEHRGKIQAKNKGEIDMYFVYK